MASDASVVKVKCVSAVKTGFILNIPSLFCGCVILPVILDSSFYSLRLHVGRFLANKHII